MLSPPKMSLHSRWKFPRRTREEGLWADTWVLRSSRESQPAQGRRGRPYHSLLQLLCSPVLEDGQPVMKGDDHKGRQGHRLVIAYQAPLVSAGREAISQEGRRQESAHRHPWAPPPAAPACPCG